jgi:purine-binding chemotaxis protein CheW
MERVIHLLVMSLDAQQFALPLSSVERVLRAVELTPLPESPPHVLGVLNVQGRVMAAISLRRRCRLPERDLEPSDQFVIVHTPRGPTALIVDRAVVMECQEAAVVPALEVLPDSDFVVGVLKREDNLILVCDVDALIALPQGPLQITSAISSPPAAPL